MKVVNQGITLLYLESIRDRAKFMIKILEITDKYSLNGAKLEIDQAKNLLGFVEQSIRYAHENAGEVDLISANFYDTKKENE